MLMRKILPIILVGGIVFAVVRFKLYEGINIQQVSRKATTQTQAQVKKVSNNILGAAVSTIKKQVDAAATGVNDFLDQKTQQIVSGGTAIPVTVVSVNDESVPANETPIIIDFLSEIPYPLSFHRNKDYYVAVRNTPPRFCLFIEAQEYRIEADKLLKLSFAEGGSYRLSFNYCRESNTKFGEIVVK